MGGSQQKCYVTAKGEIRLDRGALPPKGGEAVQASDRQCSKSFLADWREKKNALTEEELREGESLRKRMEDEAWTLMNALQAALQVMTRKCIADRSVMWTMLDVRGMWLEFLTSQARSLCRISVESVSAVFVMTSTAGLPQAMARRLVVGQCQGGTERHENSEWPKPQTPTALAKNHLQQRSSLVVVSNQEVSQT